MNVGSAERRGPAPLLVLGLGNPLLSDDGVGLEMLKALTSHASETWGRRVELVDGGTQGLALLGRIEGRRALVVLDAVSRGSDPGTVHVLDGLQALGLAGPPSSVTPHEGGAAQLLSAAALLGDLPPRVQVVGVEPACVETGLGLSPTVQAALPRALDRARAAIDLLLGSLPTFEGTAAPARNPTHHP